MRPFNFTPHYRSAPHFQAAHSFEGLANLLDQAAGRDQSASAYPPYNIERIGENAYQIALAVAGFAEADLKIELNEQVLTVAGEKNASEHADQAATDVEVQRQFLHRGIAGRTFARRFQLAEHVEVRSATLADGLLRIDLVRNVPERLKARQIPIGLKSEVSAQLTGAV